MRKTALDLNTPPTPPGMDRGEQRVRPQTPPEPGGRGKGRGVPIIAAVMCCLLVLALVLWISPGPEEAPGWEDNILRSDPVTYQSAVDHEKDDEAAEFPVFGSRIKRGQVKTVTILDTLAHAPEDAWDVSASRDGSVLAWVEPYGEFYDLFIGADGGVNAGLACRDLFAGYSRTERFNSLENLHTDQATDMSRMFFGCSGMPRLELTGFRTGEVRDMSHMFDRCWSLTELDLSGFDTSSVTDMSSMFTWCEQLRTLDLRNFDTAAVTDMSNMFGICSVLAELDLSSFDTSAVEDMSSMFIKCDQLRMLDLSSFNTASVRDMSFMFYSCDGLTKLDLSSFDTSRVRDLHQMFSSCEGLTELDVSSFDTSGAEDLGGMFAYCSMLTDLKPGRFHIADDAYVGGLFYDCPGLTMEQLSFGESWMEMSPSALEAEFLIPPLGNFSIR